MSAIELRGVAKQYPPREPGSLPQDLLRGVDLVVRRGEFVAVEGQSGSGKSTLLHVLGGLDREFAGEALVLGCDLRAVTDAELAALRHTQIGFVFQSFNLLPALTALENVLLPDFFGDGVPDAQRPAREALDRVGLADKARARPAARAPSPGRWWRGHLCSWRTSPPGTSTRAPAKERSTCSGSSTGKE